jgi:nitrous oxidase accessory protein NosD
MKNLRNQTHLALLLCLAAPLVPAQPNGDRLNRANVVISEPGMYILDRNLTATAATPAIDITASNVTLDLNGYTITGPGGKQGTGIRVRNAQSVRVSNGKTVNFAFHVMIANSANVTVEGLQIRGEGLQVTAPPPEVAVMIVQSRNVVVENNNIYNTGLGIFVRGGLSWGNRFVNNNLTAGTNGALGICYNPADDDARGPRADLIEGNHIANYGTGIQLSTTSVYNIVRENTIAHGGIAIEDRSANNRLVGNIEVRLP